MKTCRRGHVYSDERKQCPVCAKANNRMRYQRDREKRIRASVEYYKQHKDKKKEQYLRYKEKYPERIVPWDWKKFKKDNPLHSIWSGMKSRCDNPNDSEYANYGGRGITVSDEWSKRGGYKRFAADMGSRPSARHTLDRIDNNLGYSKENCKWSTRKEQGSNRRVSALVTIFGVTKTKSEWAQDLGLSHTGFNNRIKRGWTEERLLEMVHKKYQSPLGTRRRLEDAVVLMFQVLGDADYNGREEIVQLLKEIGLFSVATKAA